MCNQTIGCVCMRVLWCVFLVIGESATRLALQCKLLHKYLPLVLSSSSLLALVSLSPHTVFLPTHFPCSFLPQQKLVLYSSGKSHTKQCPLLFTSSASCTANLLQEQLTLRLKEGSMSRTLRSSSKQRAGVNLTVSTQTILIFMK